MIGAYQVGLSTTTGLAGAVLTSVQRGYDVSWLDGYPEAVKALTREQVNRAVHTHLDPGAMILVEAGSIAGSRAAAPPAGAAANAKPPHRTDRQRRSDHKCMRPANPLCLTESA